MKIKVSMTIWKYRLSVDDVDTFWIPIGAKPLTVAWQGNDLCLWLLVNPAAEQELRTVYIHGTGHTFDVTGKQYIGTFQMLNGAFVGHVFINEVVQ